MQTEEPQKTQPAFLANWFPLPRRRDFLVLNLGLIITALGVVLFKAPNHFAMGGTSGLSILLANVVPWLNVGMVMLGINGLLVLLGFLFLGRGFGGSTVYSSIALSVYTWLLEWAFPLKAPLTDDTLLELIWAVILPAVGSAMVFNVGSSTGGTDIVAMILSKKTSLEIGKALLACDILIACGAGLMFGVKTFLYCVLGTVMKSFLMDNVIEGFNVRKQVTIVSRKSVVVKEYIIHTLGRGASVYKATGAFTSDPQEIIITVLTRRQAMLLRNFMRKTDPKAFMTIVNSSETIGKGFRAI